MMCTGLAALVAVGFLAAPFASAPGPECADPSVGSSTAPALRLEGWPALGPDGEAMAVNGAWRLEPVPVAASPWRRLESNEPDAPRCAWEATTPSGHRLALEWSTPFARDVPQFTLAIARGDDVIARASREPGAGGYGSWGLSELFYGARPTRWVVGPGGAELFRPGAAQLAPSEAALRPRPCGEPEAQALGALVVRLEEWPVVDRAGFDMPPEGTASLAPFRPDDSDALCTWRGALASGHAAELALVRSERGRAFRLRVLSPSGFVLASGERGAVSPLHGAWALRSGCTIYCTTWKRPNGPEMRYLPGAAIVAGSEAEAAALAKGDAVLDPPTALAESLASGQPNPDGNLTADLAMKGFNLDVRSRRLLAVAAARSLGSSDAKRRDRAAYVLRQLGPGARPAVPALARALSDRDRGVALSAAEALADLGLEAAPAARELAKLVAKPPGTWGRAQAARALGACGAAGRPHLAVLVAATRDPEVWVAGAAAKALGALGVAEPRVLKALTEAVASPNPGVRLDAARSLGALGEGERALVTLTALLGSKDVNDRLNAAEALGSLGPAAVPAAGKALADESFLVRRRARLALERIGTAEALQLAKEHDATTASARFWDELRGAAGRREPIPPELLARVHAYLPWGRGKVRIRAEGLVLFRTADLREPAADLGRVGAEACDPTGLTCQGEDLAVTIMERRGDRVLLRTADGSEGWTRRSAFRARTVLFVTADGAVAGELASSLDHLGQYATLGVRVEGNRLLLHLYREGGGYFFQLDPRTLQPVGVELEGRPWERGREGMVVPERVRAGAPLPVPEAVRALLPPGDRAVVRSGDLTILW